MQELTQPYYYVFYTGNTSTPWSVGIAKRLTILGTGEIIKEVKIEAHTGKETREIYNTLSSALKAECETLNITPTKKQWTKKQFKDATVPELLTAMYNNEIHEVYLHDVVKGKLSEFVLEIFNKGLLNDYLNLKRWNDINVIVDIP